MTKILKCPRVRERLDPESWGMIPRQIAIRDIVWRNTQT
jgi:hypothetical protein